ncbi:MAG: flippase-like domain-containing protein, partial [Firmicutes bacterium]|nr:flippase-like domain-containing protein [Bacillota bacterium]
MDNKPTLKNHARRRIIFWSIFIVLTLGAMTWTFYRDFGGGNAFAVWEDIRSQLSRNWWWLVLAIGAMIFARCCMILFSGTVFHLFTGKMHLKTAFSNNMVKNFYGKVAQPAGGYPFCMYYLSKQKHLPDGVAITLPVFNYTLSHIMDFFLGISAIILMTTNVFNTTEQLPTWILIT